MTLTTIEKAAKLIGYKTWDQACDEGIFVGETGEVDLELFNPYTNKSDLMDVECELGIDVEWDNAASGPNVKCAKRIGSKFAYSKVWLDNHPDKFTARAHAVMAVVEQIYDRREG